MPDIYHQFEIRGNREAVFDAIAKAEGLNSWWTLEAGGEPVLGSEYRFYFGPEYDWLAKVVEVRSGHEIRWSLVRAMDDWLPTTFGFELADAEQGTTVRFSHTGWTSEGEHFAITSFCWGQLLNGLKNYVENGVVIPFEKRN